LVEQQIGTHARKGGDLIKSKGQGLAILFHGPPGVGKTLTAESITEHVQRPLHPLSIGNLVSEKSSMEELLLAIFRKATRLNAILLLAKPT
jgi:DNA helicase TIP49 (TBP-interacting protein)